MGLEKTIHNKLGNTPIKNAVLRRTATVTALDHRTVGEMDQAINTLNSKIEKGKLSEKTLRATEKQVKRLQEQRNKTLKLFRKYKKDSRLRSLSDSTVSVYKIWSLLGRQTQEITTDGQAFGKWALQNGGENAVAMLGGGMAIAGLLATKVGEGEARKAIGKILFEKMGAFVTNLWTTNPGLLVGLGGAALLAGVMVKKGIRKKMAENAAAKQDAENEMNKGTAYDHAHVASSATNAAAFQQLAARAATDESVYQHLFEVASNPNNDPATITQANKILAAARAQIKANETQALQAALTAHMNSSNTLYSSTETIKSAISNFATYEEVNALREDANVTIDTRSVTDATHKGNLDGLNGITNPRERENRIKGKDEASFAAEVLGPRPEDEWKDPDDHSKGLTDACKEAQEKYDEAVKVAKQIFKKFKAEVEFRQRENAGEFSYSGGVFTIKNSDGIDITYNPADIENSVGYFNYIEAVQCACDNAGIDTSKFGGDKEKIVAHYLPIVEEAKKAMCAEKAAERTGMVK